MSPRKSASPSKEIIAQYLTAELDSLTQRALQQENMLANKINFYLVTVTAVGGGLILAVSVTTLQNLILAISGLVALVLHVMGWVTLSQGLDLRTNTTVTYRRMGRIRQWFLEYDPTLLPYLPFTPGDDRPLFYAAYAPIRSIDSILLLVNSLTVGAFASLAWFFISFQLLQLQFARDGYPFLIAVGIGMLASAFIWSLQIRYIRRFMLDREAWEAKYSRVHFPLDEAK